MKPLSSLSMVFPAYNDAPSLPQLIAKANRAARMTSRRYEIIVVNDGSQDDTRDVLQKLQRRYSRLRVVHHRKNKGYGSAARSGFRAARYSWIFYTDGDGQYDPSELSKLVAALDAKTDVVNGYRISRSDSAARKVTGKLYSSALHLLYKLPIRDIDCDFRLIRRANLRDTKFRSSSGMFPLELVLALQHKGARFKEVPVHHYPRVHGRSQFFRAKHLVATLKEFFIVR